MEINKFTTKEEATAGAGEALNKLLNINKQTPILLLPAGGSTFAILDYVNSSSMGENLTITMLDERFSQDAQINNFLQLQKLDFFNLALSVNTNFVGTLPRMNESIKEMEFRLEKNIENWIQNNPNGKIFATIGMGPDGHIAGIFPNQSPSAFRTLFENKNLYTSYTMETNIPFKERITSTFTMLKKIDSAIVFVCGQEKKLKFNELIEKKFEKHILPAMGIYLTKHFQIFTDVD